jgi:hypothetical protein
LLATSLPIFEEPASGSKIWSAVAEDLTGQRALSFCFLLSTCK